MFRSSRFPPKDYVHAFVGGREFVQLLDRCCQVWRRLVQLDLNGFDVLFDNYLGT
jgi:hypothetical protein